MNMSFKKGFAVSAIAISFLCVSVIGATSAFAQSAPSVTIPAPVNGQVQGMITSVGNRFVTIDNVVVTLDGDTVTAFNGSATVLSVGQLVNYSYTVDVDGVILATTMDVYDTVAVSGVERVSRLDVTNSTGGVALTLYDGRVVEYFQPYAFITGIGTNTSYGNHLVHYEGFLNPVTGHILATGGYMSPVPVSFVTSLPDATVGEVYNAYAINIYPYGMGDLFQMTVSGLPEGMTNNRGVISGTPTTAGSYTIDFTATGGWTVGYANLGSGSVTLVVKDQAPVAPVVSTTTPVVPTPVDPTPAPVACDATGVIMNFGTSKTFLDVSVNGAAPVKVAFATQANTTFVAPLTNFVDGAIVTYTGTLDASGVICHADTMTVEAAPVVDVSAPTLAILGTNPVALTVGDVYVDAGATCVDDIDAACAVVTTGAAISTAVAGSFTVTYTATDAAGNVSVATRAVKVSAPVVTPITSTGKKVEATYVKITSVSPTRITVGKVVLLIDSTTVIKLQNKKPLAVGATVEYKGILNSDGTVKATSIKAQ
jgi:hypothetical protein